MSDKSTANDHLSIERLLSWFGHFTPQLKYRLLLFKRHLSLADFELHTKEVMALFRHYFNAFSRLNKGKERALFLYELMDKKGGNVDKSKVSCSKGCAACYEAFPKQISEDEADLLATLIHDGFTIDQEELERQAVATKDVNTEDQFQLSRIRCVFLGEDRACRIYDLRPATCRKYDVTSPQAACSSENETVTPQIDLFAEVLVSAALSMSDNPLGWMPSKISEQLQLKRAAQIAGSPSPGVEIRSTLTP